MCSPRARRISQQRPSCHEVPMRRRLAATATGFAAVLACLPAACALGDANTPPMASPADTVGPNPRIAPVEKTLIPTVQIAPAKGWPAGGKPRAAADVSVNAYATGLSHPRWL